jgi:aryl-alcohol dehydrogenase-like predicted oxidoreductase
MVDTLRIDVLGRDVARVALGTSSMGGGQWAGAVDEDAALETVLHALELGLDVIDTAPVYGKGRAEEIVGRALDDAGARKRAVVATKFGWAWEDDEEPHRDASRESILREVDASLGRLRTDYIDIYQLHFPDPTTPLRETAETLGRLFEEGTIHAVGVCNLTAEQLREWLQYGPLHAVQERYNLFERDVEKAVLPFCREHGLTFLAYMPLARGLLTGTMKPGQPPTDRAHDAPMFGGEEYGRHLLAAERVGHYAEEISGAGLPAVAVRWVLDRSGGIALWGARRPQHLDAVTEVWGWRLDEPNMQAIDHLVTESLDAKLVRAAPVRRL